MYPRHFSHGSQPLCGDMRDRASPNFDKSVTAIAVGFSALLDLSHSGGITKIPYDQCHIAERWRVRLDISWPRISGLTPIRQQQ